VRGGGGGFLVTCVSLMLNEVLGVEKVLLVLGTSRVVCWVLTFTADAFWGCTGKFKKRLIRASPAGTIRKQ